MKKLCSVLLVLSLGLNQVGVNCRAANTNEEFPIDIQAAQSEIEKTRFNLEQNNSEVEKTTNSKDLQVENKAISSQNKVTETLPKKQNIVIRLLKAVGKCGVFVVKKFIWLLLVFVVSSCGSYFVFSEAMEKSEHAADFMKEFNSFLYFLRENGAIAESILVKLLDNVSSDSNMGVGERCQKLIRTIAAKFHPDRLKKAQNLSFSTDECEVIYQLAADASDEARNIK